MIDIIKVRRDAKDEKGMENRIMRKHFDFIICEAETMKALAAIELDGVSHDIINKADRVKNAACKDAGLKLLRVKVQQEYHSDAILKIFTEAGSGKS